LVSSGVLRSGVKGGEPLVEYDPTGFGFEIPVMACTSRFTSWEVPSAACVKLSGSFWHFAQDHWQWRFVGKCTLQFLGLDGTCKGIYMYRACWGSHLGSC